MDLIELFCEVDNFCQCFEPEWEKHQLQSSAKRRNRLSRLTLSEVMTIVIAHSRFGLSDIQGLLYATGLA